MHLAPTVHATAQLPPELLEPVNGGGGILFSAFFCVPHNEPEDPVEDLPHQQPHGVDVRGLCDCKVLEHFLGQVCFSSLRDVDVGLPRCHVRTQPKVANLRPEELLILHSTACYTTHRHRSQLLATDILTLVCKESNGKGPRWPARAAEAQQLGFCIEYLGST